MAKATSAQADADTESDELRGWLREIYSGDAGEPSMSDLRVPWDRLLERVNARRKAAGYQVWASKSSALKTAMRELGFEDGKSIVRRNTGRVAIFDSEVRKRLGIDEGSLPPIPSKSEPGPDPGDLFEGRPTRADSVRDRVASAEPESEMDLAVRTLGPTITYPDGTVADRRTGSIIHRRGAL
jgi:hypothetical protein